MPTGPDAACHSPLPTRHCAASSLPRTVFSRLPRPYETSFICGGRASVATIASRLLELARTTVLSLLPTPNLAWASPAAQLV